MQDIRPNRNLYVQLDQLRRHLGKCVDAMGWTPLETPFRSIVTERGVTLRCYGEAAAGPVIVLVPAPIKGPSIWDLAPWASVVRRCMDSGLRVYLLRWERPGVDERDLGLADYADRLILDCLATVQAETGQTAVLAGHSLGGTCAALFAALHPERVKGLILLGAPLCFGPEVGLFGPVVAVAPHARTLTAGLGNIPGSALNSICLLASPATFGVARWLDWLGSLTDAKALLTHLLVERWTLDEMPLPQRLFEELVELLYREDRFMQRTLMIGKKRVAPEQVMAPLLSVVDRRCTIVPPGAVLPFHQAARSPVKRLLWYQGDIGVSLQHVGMLVGESAHRQLWPELISWVKHIYQPMPRPK